MKNKNTMQRLLMIASIGLDIAGIVFICLSLFGYEKERTLPAALGYIALATLFQIVFHTRN